MQKGFTEPVTSIEPKTLDLSERHNAVRNSRGGDRKLHGEGRHFLKKKKTFFIAEGSKLSGCSRNFESIFLINIMLKQSLKFS